MEGKELNRQNHEKAFLSVQLFQTLTQIQRVFLPSFSSICTKLSRLKVYNEQNVDAIFITCII